MIVLSESGLQKKILNHLDDNNWLAFKMPPIVVGFPDIMALKNGKVIFLELKKQNKGKIGYFQAKMALKLEKYGFLHKFLDNFNDYLELMDSLK